MVGVNENGYCICFLSVDTAYLKGKLFLLQTAESVAESMLNLASADSVVMVTVDSADDTRISNINNMVPPSVSVTDAPVVVHSSADAGSTISTPVLAVPTDLLSMGLGATAALNNPVSEHIHVMETLSIDNTLVEEGAEGGNVTPSEGLMELDPHRPPPRPYGTRAGRHDNRKVDSQTRTTPTNPMSVSVPNLTSNMEQTVSLLESFAAVARRNLGNNSNNISRYNNASSLVRLALASNSNGKFTNASTDVTKLHSNLRVYIEIATRCQWGMKSFN